jgi:hypothetical protein
MQFGYGGAGAALEVTPPNAQIYKLVMNARRNPVDEE